MKAFEVGVKHAMLWDNALDVFGLYPNKKQKTMPPVPRSKYVSAKARSKIYKSKGRKNTSIIKKTILSMATTYNDQQNDNVVTSNVLHNTIYSNNITAKVTQGTADDTRQGDSIFLQGLKIKGTVQTPTASNGYQYRVLVGWSGKEFNVAGFGTPGASTGLSAADIFLPFTGALFQTAAVVNPKAFTVLYDQTLDLNSQLSGVSDLAGLDMYIPMNKKFSYQAGASLMGKTKNLYVIVCAIVSNGGVTGVTLAGIAHLNTVLQFKNL